VRSSSFCARTHCLLRFPDESKSTSIDLSKATKLKRVEFQPTSWTVQWIIVALQTITPKHRDFRQIAIHVLEYLVPGGVGANVEQTIGEANYGQWLNLDRLLVQVWESRSIRPRVIFTEEQGMGDCNCVFAARDDKARGN
jgi:hypothetical protein